MKHHIEHLRRFGLFLAREFDGAQRGEWRCPMIGAEAATGVVEAIAAVEALEAKVTRLTTLATEATNALACVARAKYQHNEVSRLHAALRAEREQ